MKYIHALLFMSPLIVSCANVQLRKMKANELLVVNPKDTATSLKEKLTLGENQLSAGYSTSVTLITDPLIELREKQIGKENLEAEELITSRINEQKKLLTKSTTCFIVSVSTYHLETAYLKNWVAKIRDSAHNLKEIQWSNLNGVDSVPTTYKDLNGRTWHNSSIGCTKEKIDITKTFQMILVPQIKNFPDADESTTLTWEIIP